MLSAAELNAFSRLDPLDDFRAKWRLSAVGETREEPKGERGYTRRLDFLRKRGADIDATPLTLVGEEVWREVWRGVLSCCLISEGL